MSFRGRIFTGSLSYPQDASKFLSVAVSLGGSFTTTQKRALGYLVNNLADLGIGAPGSNFIIYPFIGGSSSAVNALNLFYPETTANNLTFVGSPTHSTSGVTFNGTTQYASGQSLSTYPLTPNLTMANLSFGVCVSGMGSGTYVPMGFFMAAALQTKTYSTAGTFSFNPNTEAPGNTLVISAWGGGGAGGGANATTNNRPGGGGAGGGYAARTGVTFTTTQGETSMTITVGSGGTPSSGAAGGAGGDSTVTHPNVTPTTAKGGPGGNVNTSGAAGAAVAGAAGNAGTTTFVGGAGAAGGAGFGNGGGGGGSSAGTAASGNAGTTPTTTTGGAGGTAPTNGVAGGAGGNGVLGGAGFAGNPGTAGGGGGGGAGSSSAPNNRAGGAGGDGKVTIAWTPTTLKRVTMSIFNSGTSNNQLLDIAANGDPSSRYSYQTSPLLLNGVRVGSRRGNTGTSADMGFYVQNNAGSALVGPAAMTPDASLSQTPIFYFGAGNSWAAGGSGVGNTPGNFLSGTLNFAFLGPGLSDTQLQSLFTLITTYNGILGR
jgi:hypothetical protein